MEVNLSRDLEFDSVTNGPGLRTVIWFQGCSFNCKGCHNPDTHSFDKGVKFTTKDIVDKIKKISYIKSVTFSGGDPIAQYDGLLEIAKNLKSLDIDIWMYSAELFENIKDDKDRKELLKYIDVLVDGPFVISQLNLNLDYRGSNNQRLIDVKKSLIENKTVEYNIT